MIDKPMRNIYKPQLQEREVRARPHPKTIGFCKHTIEESIKISNEKSTSII